jgi:hypothetical protein
VIWSVVVSCNGTRYHHLKREHSRNDLLHACVNMAKIIIVYVFCLILAAAESGSLIWTSAKLCHWRVCCNYVSFQSTTRRNRRIRYFVISRKKRRSMIKMIGFRPGPGSGTFLRKLPRFAPLVSLSWSIALTQCHVNISGHHMS